MQQPHGCKIQTFIWWNRQDADSFQTQVAENYRKWPGCTGACLVPHPAAPNTSSSLCPWSQPPAFTPAGLLMPCRVAGEAWASTPISSWHRLFPKQKQQVLTGGCCIEQRSHSDTRSDRWLLYRIITTTSPPRRFLKLTLLGRMLQGYSKVRKNHSNKYRNFACVFCHLISHQCVEAKVLFI